MSSKLSKKEGRRLAAELLTACGKMADLLNHGCSNDEYNATLKRINALTQKLGVPPVPLEYRTGNDPDEFPDLRFVTENGERYAEIAGERYKLEKINGQPMLSETQLYQIIERHAPNEQAKAEALKAFRGMVSAATGSARSLQ